MNRKILLILSILIFANFLIKICFLRYYPMVDIDGIPHLRMTKDFLKSGFSDMGLLHPPLYPIFIGILHFFIKDLETCARFVCIINLCTLLIVLFLLAKTIFNEKVGYLCALSFIVHSVMTSHSLLELEVIQYAFFFFLSLYFLLLGIKRKKFFFYVLSRNKLRPLLSY